MIKLIDKTTGLDIPEFGEYLYKIGNKVVPEKKVLKNKDLYNVIEKPSGWGGYDKQGNWVDISIVERPFKITIPMSLIKQVPKYNLYATILSLIAPYFYDAQSDSISAFFKTLKISDGFKLKEDGTIICADTNIQFEYINTFEYVQIQHNNTEEIEKE